MSAQIIYIYMDLIAYQYMDYIMELQTSWPRPYYLLLINIRVEGMQQRTGPRHTAVGSDQVCLSLC